MHIVHITETLDPSSGGPIVIAIGLASAQASLGHRVSVIAHSYDSCDSHEPNGLLLDVPGGSLIDVVAIPSGGWREKLFASNTRSTIRRSIEEADIVHIHGIWSSIAYWSARIASILSVPYVIVPHGMLDPWSLNQKRLRKKLALRLFQRDILNGAIFLHLGNSEERSLLEPLGLLVQTELIPNGVFPQSIHPLPLPKVFREKHPKLGEAPYILFLGRLHYKKGLDFLIEAFTIFSKRDHVSHLVVAGPNGGESKYLASYIATHGLQDRVHVVGPLFGLQKFEAFSGASCFCLPSRQEGFSMAITEALCCGLPVVISKACHYNIVADVGAGIICDLDSEHIAAGLLKVMSCSKLQDEMGTAAKDFIGVAYTWHNIAKNVIRLYSRRGIVRDSAPRKSIAKS
jgi:glycosyltransferase involved in cell wall biosynthesis